MLADRAPGVVLAGAVLSPGGAPGLHHAHTAWRPTPGGDALPFELACLTSNGVAMHPERLGDLNVERKTRRRQRRDAHPLGVRVRHVVDVDGRATQKHCPLPVAIHSRLPIATPAGLPTSTSAGWESSLAVCA